MARGRSRRPAGASATAVGPPLSRRWADVPGTDGAVRGAVVRAEHDDVGAAAGDELAQALARRCVDDHVLLGGGSADDVRGAFEQLRRLLGLEDLLHRVRGARVAHVREAAGGAGVAQEPAERERVAICVGSVVGHDERRAHGASVARDEHERN